MTERETQPTADDKYTVHSMTHTYMYVHVHLYNVHLVMCHITCTVFIVVSIYTYMCSYTDSLTVTDH